MRPRIESERFFKPWRYAMFDRRKMVSFLALLAAGFLCQPPKAAGNVGGSVTSTLKCPSSGVLYTNATTTLRIGGRQQ